MTKFLNLHRLKTNNIGDLKCAPYLYFDQKIPVIGREILGFMPREVPTQPERREWKERFFEAAVIIVGGGGLLELDFFMPGLTYIFQNKRQETKVVVWGAGHNDWKLGDWRHLKRKYHFEGLPFDLIGVRDHGHPYEWVPCVSCMDPIFDRKFEVKHPIVMYAHEGTYRNENLRKTLPQDVPLLTNSADFETAITFLGEAELVLTDSFHGAYWATLMGRKVIAFPSSSKFYDYKHPVPLCDPTDWQRFQRMATSYPEALEECRSANTTFADKVAALA
ncbi:polysaccharide pyruvyl transferase family protein [Bosea sp. 117]|uniref:polysaccharide pyruvyl transferase family protein n=1 Tax=Bosea sp. 117 TaxID=1125973 RepID=UPI0004949191|nr:polysaccharide pyruvyl transferase family protein [Bosea sp. 117]